MTTLNADGLIFDLNGTIVDDMPIHFKVWHQYLRNNGSDATFEEVLVHTSGQSSYEIIRHFFGEARTDQECFDMGNEKEALYREIYEPEPLAGLLDLLAAASERQLPMAVVTSANRPNASHVLDTLDLRRYFDIVVTLEDVHHHKPDPEALLKAAAHIGVTPSRCIVFEDTLTGLEAARRANMHAVAMLTTLEPDRVAHFPHLLTAVPDYTTLRLT